MKKLIAQLCSVVLFVALLNYCTQAPKEVKYQNKNFSTKFDSTNAYQNSFAQIKIDYIEFSEAVSSEVKDSLNKHVNNFINSAILEKKTNSPQELAAALIADFKKVKSEFPDSPINYELERKAEVLNETKQFIALHFSEYSFLGGAHPNSNHLFKNINLSNGKTILLDELFVEGYKSKLNEIAEKYFRLSHSLKLEDDLEKAGFWFKENKFSVNDNFSLTKEAIKFFFNSYEVAPYVLGSTEIEIRYDGLTELLKKDGLIQVKVPEK